LILWWIKKVSKLVTQWTPSNQASRQSSVLATSPTILSKSSLNKMSTTNPSLLQTSHHMLPPSWSYCPPSLMRPSSDPYLVLNTLYHKLPWATYIYQHHFPNNGKLNLGILRTFNSLFSLSKKIVFVSTPKKNLKIDLIDEMIHEGALKKKIK